MQDTKPAGRRPKRTKPSKMDPNDREMQTTMQKAILMLMVLIRTMRVRSLYPRAPLFGGNQHVAQRTARPIVGPSSSTCMESTEQRLHFLWVAVGQSSPNALHMYSSRLEAQCMEEKLEQVHQCELTNACDTPLSALTLSREATTTMPHVRPGLLQTRVARKLGRAPRGVLEAQWLVWFGSDSSKGWK